MSIEPVQTIADSSFCPAHFIDRKTGKPNLADLRYAVEWLRAKAGDDDPDRFALNNIDQVYVVGGRVSAMAELQRTLARRAGYDLEVVASDDDHATVQIRTTGPGSDRWRLVTVTMAQATRAKWTERNPSYATMPDRMLLARACTRAISLYAPDASRLIGLEEGGSDTDNRTAPDLPRDGRDDELHTVRRDEPAVAPERIAHLRGQIEGLSLADQDALRSICKSLRMPNIDSAAFTLRDAALLHRLINELRPEDWVVEADIEDDPTRPFDDDL